MNSTLALASPTVARAFRRLSCPPEPGRGWSRLFSEPAASSPAPAPGPLSPQFLSGGFSAAGFLRPRKLLLRLRSPSSLSPLEFPPPPASHVKPASKIQDSL